MDLSLEIVTMPAADRAVKSLVIDDRRIGTRPAPKPAIARRRGGSSPDEVGGPHRAPRLGVVEMPTGQLLDAVHAVDEGVPARVQHLGVRLGVVLEQGPRMRWTTAVASATV
jgi:hypothetical protein